MSDLLPCPFCGSAPRHGLSQRFGQFFAQCETCARQGRAVWALDDSEEDVARGWNRRAPAPARTRWRVSPWRAPVVIERRHVRRIARPS